MTPSLIPRLLAAVILCGALTAQASVAPSLGVTSARGFTDRDAELFLNLSRATNTTAFQFDLSFDPAHADRIAPVWSQLLSNHVVRTHELKSGLWRTLIYSPTNALLRPSLSVASLPFHIPSTERGGSGPIAPSKFVLAHPDATAFEPVSTRSGRIFVTQVSPPDLDGSVSIFFPVTKQGDYVLFASDDFSAWTPIATNAAAGNIVDFIDLDAARFPHRFYFMNDATASALSLPQWAEVKGQPALRFTAPAAGTYELEASEDLKTWSAVGGFAQTAGAIDVPVPSQANPKQRFFRLRPR